MKKTLIVISILFLCLTVFQISNSFGLFETSVDNTSELSIAKWHIYVNDNDITGSGKTFYVDDITYSGSGVSDGKFAPGVTGTFDLVIDPKDTEVAFTYQIRVDLSSYSQINVDSIEGINGTELTKVDDVYEGKFTLDDINNSLKNYVRVTFSWDKDKDDSKDTTIGESLDTLEIPVYVKFSQYK